MEGASIQQMGRAPLREGETIIIIEPQGQKHYVQLRKGGKFHHIRTGHVAHDHVIGQPPGSLLLSELEIPVVCLRLTIEDYIFKKLKRRTSIIHPKDLSSILIRGNLAPGARVLEGGIGSGSATITLMRFLGSNGTLISYERRRECIEAALSNIEEVHRLYGDPGTSHRVIEADIYDGIREQDLDLILLDVPEPHRVIESASQSLNPGGTLLCWLPTVTQVYLLVRQLQESPNWALVETRETLERSWEVADNAIRPYHRMVGHTGFLIHARNLATPDGLGRWEEVAARKRKKRPNREESEPAEETPDGQAPKDLR